MKKEHLDYFNKKLAGIKHSVNVAIPILPTDHSLIKGHKNALGICHGTKNPGKNDWKPEKITIDEYFIEECYEVDVNGKWYMAGLLEGEDLVSVIAHEIAHIHVWRHGKKHRELTRRIIRLVKAGKPHGIVQRNDA